MHLKKESKEASAIDLPNILLVYCVTIEQYQ